MLLISLSPDLVINADTQKRSQNTLKPAGNITDKFGFMWPPNYIKVALVLE